MMSAFEGQLLSSQWNWYGGHFPQMMTEKDTRLMTRETLFHSKDIYIGQEELEYIQDGSVLSIKSGQGHEAPGRN